MCVKEDMENRHETLEDYKITLKWLRPYNNFESRIRKFAYYELDYFNTAYTNLLLKDNKGITIDTLCLDSYKDISGIDYDRIEVDNDLLNAVMYKDGKVIMKKDLMSLIDEWIEYNIKEINKDKTEESDRLSNLFGFFINSVVKTQ